LTELALDIALLQEVSALLKQFKDRYSVIQMHPVTKNGGQQKFKTMILGRGSLGQSITLRGPAPWVNTELRRFAGNLIGVEVNPDRARQLNVICVHSPAWPVARERLVGVDVAGIRLTQNRNVWVADLLWAALSLINPKSSDPWIIAGDFNLCETFDSWPGGPRGNREYLDRLQRLGLVDCLRYQRGALTPTLRKLRSGAATGQLDYPFVTDELRSRLLACDTGSRQHVFEGGLSDHLPVIADFAPF
jgi:endonuclease/exonuclease/phosphatase family metal-dependent hydrolase